MLVRRGHSIMVESSDFVFKRSCQTPGLVTVTRKHGDKETFELWANEESTKTFIEAYQRIVDEDVAYSEWERE